ncbi:MAG: hypothetical protein AAF840_11180, partial [Bacteroidota bacterium]
GISRQQLPPGHYLSATLNEEELRVAYFSTYDYELEVFKNKGQFACKLFDPDGLERTDAQVLADGKPVKYAAHHAAYRRRDWRIERLQVIVEQDTLFFAVDEKINRSRTAHTISQIGRKQPIRTLMVPYYTVSSLVNVVKDGISRSYWHGPRYYPFKGTIYQLTHPAPVAGYVTTSQPKYRPGDTLQISAYLTKPKGRPLAADSIQLQIGNYRHKLFKGKIGRQDKGRYTLKMAIPDSWPLDETYRISFNLPGILRRRVDPKISFRVEDYELAEYKLEVEASKDARLPRSAWLDVAASDVNGLALPNGLLQVTVLTNRFLSGSDTATLVLPDTLYTYSEPTDNQLERRIILPDSIFPKGYSLQVNVKTQLTGPSGEYQEVEQQMIVNRRHPLIPKLKVEGDSLLAFLAPLPSPAPAAAPKKEATLLTISPTQDTLRQTLQLPAKLALDHEQAQYQLRYGKQTVREILGRLEPTSGDPVRWSRDTLRLSFANPHQQPLRWQLLQEGVTIATGNQDTLTFERSGFVPEAPLRLQYQYLAGGKWRYEFNGFQAPAYHLLTEHPKVLDFTLSQPAKVKPGETVRVALKATDQKGRPAANVRLTAGTYNARFKKSPVTTPSYRSKRKYKRARQDYSQEEFHLDLRLAPPLWLLQDFGMDTALAYQLRFPQPSFSHVRSLDTILPDTLAVAHLAPFVVRNHDLETVRTVYANNRLVYWWHPNITTPYSIQVDTGWQEIQLRTDNHRYTKRLHFADRQQYVLSFDAERWVAAGWYRERITSPTRTELDNLYGQVFALTQMSGDQIYQFRSNPSQPIQSGYNRHNGTWSP